MVRCPPVRGRDCCSDTYGGVLIKCTKKGFSVSWPVGLATRPSHPEIRSVSPQGTPPEVRVLFMTSAVARTCSSRGDPDGHVFGDATLNAALKRTVPPQHACKTPHVVSDCEPHPPQTDFYSFLTKILSLTYRILVRILCTLFAAKP